MKTNPLVNILACIRRMIEAGCPFPSCLTLLWGWAHESIAERNAAAVRALAIDDPLERAAALIELALRNDAPALRRQILAVIAEVHRRTEEQAAELRVQIPLALQDHPAI